MTIKEQAEQLYDEITLYSVLSKAAKQSRVETIEAALRERERALIQPLACCYHLREDGIPEPLVERAIIDEEIERLVGWWFADYLAAKAREVGDVGS